MWNTVLLNPSEDLFVDVILSRYGDVGPSGTWQRPSDRFRQATRLLRLVLCPKQGTVRFFHAVVIHLRRGWLLLLRQRPYG